MENDAKIILKQSRVFASISLYDCIPIAQLSSTGNYIEDGEATKAIHKPFKNLFHEKRQSKLFDKYSVIVTESKAELDCLETTPASKMRPLHLIKAERKREKRFT